MSRERITGRYWNSNGFAAAVVASVTYRANGSVLDWAAYVGGTDRVQHKADAIDWVAQMGDKLFKEDAKHFFPDLPIELYRS